MKYRIESRGGVVFGVYTGDDPKAAFLAMLKEAGVSYGDELVGTEADWIVTEVES